MQITGMLWGRKLLDLVEFTHSEVRGPELSVDEIKDMINVTDKYLSNRYLRAVLVKKVSRACWAE